MSKTRWLFVAITGLAVACANGVDGDTSEQANGGSTGGDDTGDASTAGNAGGTSGSTSGGIGGNGGGNGDGSASTGDDGLTGTGDDGSTANDSSTGGGGDSSSSNDGATASDSSSNDSSTDTGATDSGHDSGTTTDSGTDSGTTTDAGTDSGHDSGTTIDSGTDAGCQPTVGSFTPVDHAPNHQAFSCTTTQISAFYTACLDTASTNTTCSTWENKSANLICDVCLEGSSDPTGSQWGPVLYYTTSVFNDQGGCLLIDQPAKAACGHDIEHVTECEQAACDVSCGATQGQYDECVAAADNGACKTYITAENTDCAGVSSVCFGGTSFQTNFEQVAAEFCQ